MPDIHKDRVVASIESLWTSGMYSDLTIRCGFEEYKVHRSIICPRSTFFAAACNGKFEEAKTATITLNDDDPKTVERMLLYLYKLDYPDQDVPDYPAEPVAIDSSLLPQLQLETLTTTEIETAVGTTSLPSEDASSYDPRMMNHVLVYAVADKYDIPELKKLAKCKFQTLVSSKWPHNDFREIAEAVFLTTPDEDMGLRQVVMEVCVEHFQDILKDEESRAAFLNIKAIAAAVLDAAVQQNEQDKMLLDGAVARQIALEDELSKAKADLLEALEQKTTWMSRLDSLLNNANNVDSCRHCHESFAWYIERRGGVSGLGMQLRCSGCRTKELL